MILLKLYRKALYSMLYTLFNTLLNSTCRNPHTLPFVTPSKLSVRRVNGIFVIPTESSTKFDWTEGLSDDQSSSHNLWKLRSLKRRVFAVKTQGK